MLSTVFLMATLMGQTTSDGPVLSEATKKAHARALAEFRANEHTIKPRLEAYYKLENQRLTEKTATVNVATGRLLDFAAGARRDTVVSTVININSCKNFTFTPGSRSEVNQVAGGTSGFSSVPPTAPRTVWKYESEISLTELQQENYLIKGRMRDNQGLFREARDLYRAEYPMRYRLAGVGQR